MNTQEKASNRKDRKGREGATFLKTDS